MNKAICSDCNLPINFAENIGQQKPCKNCGSTRKTFLVSIDEKVITRDGLGLKAKRSSDKRPYIETLNIPDHSIKLNKVVHKTRVIDRDNDRYSETVTDYDSGEIIHHSDEPLSQHRNHGSAKFKK